MNEKVSFSKLHGDIFASQCDRSSQRGKGPLVKFMWLEKHWSSEWMLAKLSRERRRKPEMKNLLSTRLFTSFCIHSNCLLHSMSRQVCDPYFKNKKMEVKYKPIMTLICLKEDCLVIKNYGCFLMDYILMVEKHKLWINEFNINNVFLMARHFKLFFKMLWIDL